MELLAEWVYKKWAFSQHQACGLWIMALDLNASHILLQEELVAVFSTLQPHTHRSEFWCVYWGELLMENSFIPSLILYSLVYYLLCPAGLWSGKAPWARSTIAPFCLSLPLPRPLFFCLFVSLFPFLCPQKPRLDLGLSGHILFSPLSTFSHLVSHNRCLNFL